MDGRKVSGFPPRDGPVPRKAGTTLWGAGAKPGTHKSPLRRMRENKPWSLLGGHAEGVTMYREPRVLPQPHSGETPFYGRLACQCMA